MKFFNGSTYPESAKSVENDHLHLLTCDNGSFTVSHKESGRVFFEMPTLLIGTDDMFAYCTHADIMKSRDEDMTTFTSVLNIRFPSGRAEPLYAFETSAVLAATLYDTSNDLLISLNYEASALDTVLRFPTGIDNPSVNGNAFTGEMKTPFALDGELTLSDESGEIFRVAVATDAPVTAAVTEDGNIDLYLPSIAPANENNRITVNMIVGFTEYSIYE